MAPFLTEEGQRRSRDASRRPTRIGRRSNGFSRPDRISSGPRRLAIANELRSTRRTALAASTFMVACDHSGSPLRQHPGLASNYRFRASNLMVRMSLMGRQLTPGARRAERQVSDAQFGELDDSNGSEAAGYRSTERTSALCRPIEAGRLPLWSRKQPALIRFNTAIATTRPSQTSVALLMPIVFASS